MLQQAQDLKLILDLISHLEVTKTKELGCVLVARVLVNDPSNNSIGSPSYTYIVKCILQAIIFKNVSTTEVICNMKGNCFRYAILPAQFINDMEKVLYRNIVELDVSVHANFFYNKKVVVYSWV